MSPDERKAAILSLLEVAVDEKCRRAGSDGAISWLRQAHDMAYQEPSLSGPLPAVVSYRLAHALIRTARSLAELQDVDELLCKTGGLEGPARISPRLVRLAVLHRMRCHPDQADPSSLDRHIQNCYEGCLSALSVSALDLSAGTSTETVAPVQTQLFNQLELATYFLGSDYTPLEGVAVQHGIAAGVRNPAPDLGGAPACRFTAHGLANPWRMSLDLAEQEVKARIEGGEADVGFVIGTQESWFMAGRQNLVVPERAPFLLAHACGLIDIETSLSRDNDLWRQAIRRTRQALKKALAPEVAALIEADGSGVAGFRRVRLCGAVDERVRARPTDFFPEDPHHHSRGR